VNPQEITAYLAASHMAVVAAIDRNGSPHLTPKWYRYDGKVLILITRTDRLKYLNLQRDPRISMCVYDPPAADQPHIRHHMMWGATRVGRDHRRAGAREAGDALVCLLVLWRGVLPRAPLPSGVMGRAMI
jgi:predicted pyridoxine 5'-phosphate oxidase superfamily flavin-nucleotide-binding protein